MVCWILRWFLKGSCVFHFFSLQLGVVFGSLMLWFFLAVLAADSMVLRVSDLLNIIHTSANQKLFFAHFEETMEVSTWKQISATIQKQLQIHT